jgi:hypothetical protein
LGNNGDEIFKYLSTNLNFIRPIYKTLFSKRRAYAAFDIKMLAKIMDKLQPNKTILDPMSGYGVLADFCRPRGISTCSVEINPPSYLWQILCDPSRKELLMEAISALKSACKKTKKNHKIKLQATDNWFPSEAERLLKNIWDYSMAELSSHFSGEIAEDTLASILLPFIGRLCASTPGSMNIQVKQGGVVFFDGWDNDLLEYLSFLEDKLIVAYINPKSQHEIVFGDVTSNYSMGQKYSFMVTSPPYPNMRDYYSFFFPENYALEKLFCVEKFVNASVRKNLIGTSSISDIKKDNIIDPLTLASKSAQKFLSDLELWKGHKRSMADNISYYRPYYYFYFYMLQKAFGEIRKNLNDDINAYIIVVNNTARKFVIPVRSFVQETWESMDYFATEDEEFTNEKSHIGSINPKVVGFKARHMEYAIRLHRTNKL